MIDINSQTVSICGFPEEPLFWVSICCGFATVLIAFVLAEHTKGKFEGIAFMAIVLAVFSDKFFDDIGKIGLIYRLCFWLAVISSFTLYFGVDYGLLDCGGRWIS